MKAIIQSCCLKYIALVLFLGVSLGWPSPPALALSVSPQGFLAKSSLQQLVNGYSLLGSGIKIRSQAPVLAFFWIFRGPPRSDDEDLPETTAGGARGRCNALGQKLAAIVPPLSDPHQMTEGLPRGLNTRLGLTASASPKLWFYVPDHPEDVDQAEFMLQVRQANGSEQDVLEQPLLIKGIPREPGIFSIDLGSLAGTKIVLEPDRTYGWYLSLICNANRPSRNPSVSGWIRYEPYDQRGTLGILGDREQVENYIDAGLWHDALTLAAQLRCQPDATGTNSAAWTELLDSIGLADEVVQADVLQCPNQA